MNVFISWAGNDREVKNVITAKLREEQIEYFDSDEFFHTDFSQECIKNIRLSSDALTYSYTKLPTLLIPKDLLLILITYPMPIIYPEP